MQKNNFYVLTGGPGAGKTTLLNALKAVSIRCVDEVARQIIKEQQEQGGDTLPWGNRTEYTRLMLERSVLSYTAHTEEEEVIFFDRGIPDTLAYAGLIDLPDTSAIRQAAVSFRYNPLVFILPPWKEIYCLDSERSQSLEEAISTYHVMCETYESLHYQLIDVPPASIEERLRFIQQYL